MKYFRIPAKCLLLVFYLVLIATPPIIGGIRYEEEADLALMDGRYADAVRSYEQAALRLFWIDSLWGEAGQAALLAGDPQGAIRLFGEAKTLSAKAQLALGDALWQTRQPSQAVVVWQELLETGYVSGEVYERLTKAYWKDGDYTSALEYLQAWVDLEPVNAVARYQFGVLLTATRPQDALPHLMQAAILDPQFDPSVQILRASLNRAFLQDDLAYQFVESGRGLAALGDWMLAAEAFRNALAVNPKYAEAAAWLGEATSQLGGDGYPYLQMALQLAPDLAITHIFYGLYWQRAGRPQVALSEFQEAAQLEPQNPAWQILVGEAAARSGDLISALDTFKEAVRLAPNEPNYWRALVIFCIQYNAEIEDTGLPAALNLVSMAPDDWQSWDTLGQVSLALGNHDEAEGLFLKALALGPQEAGIHLHLGILYLQENEPESAYNHLIQARTDDSQNIYSSQIERLLERYFP